MTAWVGEDRNRAARAYMHEHTDRKPRKNVVSVLRRVLGPEGVAAVVEAPAVHRQIAAAVREDELEAGEPLHDPVEYETPGAEGLLQRMTDRVDEVMVEQPPWLSEPGGMDEHHHTELLHHLRQAVPRYR